MEAADIGDTPQPHATVQASWLMASTDIDDKPHFTSVLLWLMASGDTDDTSHVMVAVA